ncbi:MAG: pyridoxamine 5'-phosphate oxidase family protein [Anaerolineae bacterium]|nr:pyridoxamine 5'-phosphate oxidase family protein [Anaerolineae bacterium]MEB2288427.1 pyridoxamine 5'-phosphate oxidase family protein [Anaerolineae bacterium]
MSNYPQMPPLTQTEVGEFLSQPHIARLSTHNEDGSIQIVPILFDYVDGEILLGTQEVSRKVRNIKHSPQVSILIDDPTPPFKGVLIYGQARLDYDDALAKRTALLSRYMPPGDAAYMAQGLARQWQLVMIRVRPDRIVSFDYAKGTLV